MKKLKYRVGSIILYRSISGEVRELEVEEKSSDIKNGLPGFEGKVLSGTGGYPFAWGYNDQVVAVIKF